MTSAVGTLLTSWDLWYLWNLEEPRGTEGASKDDQHTRKQGRGNSGNPGGQLPEPTHEVPDETDGTGVTDGTDERDGKDWTDGTLRPTLQPPRQLRRQRPH